MLRASRPVARAVAAASKNSTASAPFTQIRAAHTVNLNGHAGNKADPAIPGDATSFLPGDKITGDTQIGSYPNLPMYNQQWRDGNPSAGYWDRQDRRNFGETVPEEDEVLNIFSPDVWAFPASLGVKRLAAAAVAFLGFGYLLSETQPEPHFERRSYPHDGLLEALGVDASDEVMVAKRGARA
ncbi:hypothetical protein BC939DRAFT_459676 [Gamsiella multidivaricata]|uniref:uncharacterized protein n=1 Tax=Gamsiella multidivaricata TaxID=101098 RepID=UPI00221E3794|nr:uncharacterized protein BC939DRAFT_459676 [Gamsiella multidivaricata]KAG0370655.1 hypothetical protein BGZ54_004971 [Gamsiella multidivaricata]KAI7819585.1 hypothetical protein BC939DRAFT_459676 [Gamsiella multidivaricata]